MVIIELTQDLHRLDREVIEVRQRLEQLEAQAAAKWIAIVEALPERGLSFCRLKKSTAISGGRLKNMSNGKFSEKSFLLLIMGRGILPHFMTDF